MTPEQAAQAAIRLEAARLGWSLHRNNVGALVDETGRLVRYGLANDSAKLNAAFKSSDLIGWRPLIIQPWHVGQTIAQFVTVECKAEGWRFRNTNAERAQERWLELVLNDGGAAGFATGPADLLRLK